MLHNAQLCNTDFFVTDNTGYREINIFDEQYNNAAYCWQYYV